MIPRIYDNLEKWLQPGKVVVIYGPRRVGKTTLIRQFLEKTKWDYKIDSGDNIRTQKILSSSDFSEILPYAQDAKDLLVIDEAQLIPNIGHGLKIIVDQLPDLRVVVTGSSSFELAGQIGEPLVGRKWTLTLFPVAQKELVKTTTPYRLKEQLKNFLIFGSYPEVVTANSAKEKTGILEEITNSYLFKDIIIFEGIKGAQFVFNLVKLLAFQVGNEVSVNELANNLNVNIRTVQRYLDILEKAFIIKSLTGFSRNLRKEIKSKNKYYFLDNGIRNAVISQFNDITSRNDIGQLWENFLVSERWKNQSYTPMYANNYFWRTWDQKEVDWVEEREGKLFGFEFKWHEKDTYKLPKQFLAAYPESVVNVVSRGNYLNFIS